MRWLPNTRSEAFPGAWQTARLRILGSIAGAAACLLSAAPSHAFGGSLGTGDEPPVDEARVAISVASGSTTRWAQARLRGDAGAAAWLVPAGPGARVDEVSGEWMDALDAATGPFVGALRGRELHGAEIPPAPARAAALEVLSTTAALDEFAKGWGFLLPPELTSRFRAWEQAGIAVVAAVYPPPAVSVWTAPIRVTDSLSPIVPLALTRAPQRAVRITVTALGTNRMRLGSASYWTPDLSLVGCGTARSQMLSAYEAARDSWLLQANGTQWALECATPTPRWACDTRAETGATACGAAQDLALAFGGAAGSQVWVTRVVGMVAAGKYGEDWPVELEAAAPLGPLDLGQVCTDGGAPPGADSTAAGGNSLVPLQGEQRVPPRVPPSEPDPSTSDPSDGVGYAEPSPGIDTTVFIDTTESCSGTTAPSPSEVPADEGEVASSQTAEVQESGSSSGCSGSTQPDDEYGSSESGCSGSTQPDEGYGSSESGCSGSTQPDDEYGSSESGCSGSTQPDDEYGDSEGSCSASTQTSSGNATSSSGCDASSENESDDSDAAKCALASEGTGLARSIRAPRRRIRLSAVTLAAVAVLLPVRRRARLRVQSSSER